MCMSWDEMDLDRQEYTYVETIGYVEKARTSGTSRSWHRIWESRRDGMSASLAETFAEMSDADLKDHLGELQEEHGKHPDWRPVVALVAAEVNRREQLMDTKLNDLAAAILAENPSGR